MLHTNNPIIKHKAGPLNLAEELGNVSKACQVMGVSRETFYLSLNEHHIPLIVRLKFYRFSERLKQF
jgi:predicted DNA-binding transcriptional regulator AlpA